MKIDISPELTERIQRKIESGEYSSPHAVLSEALQALEERDDGTAAVRAIVQEGIDSLESGDFTVYTKENLHELFDEVKREGRLMRKRREERKKRLAKSKVIND